MPRSTEPRSQKTVDSNGGMAGPATETEGMLVVLQSTRKLCYVLLLSHAVHFEVEFTQCGVFENK